MSISWNVNGSINWACLDRNLIQEWYERARVSGGVERFVFSFICLNHYYSAWSSESNFAQRGRSERGEVRHFATMPTVQGQWGDFVALHEVRGRSIELPMHRGKNDHILVPEGWSWSRGDETVEAADLEAADYLEVMYQIRCELFHASLPTAGFTNGRIIRFVDDPSFNLLGILIQDTTPGSRGSRS